MGPAWGPPFSARFQRKIAPTAATSQKRFPPPAPDNGQGRSTWNDALGIDQEICRAIAVIAVLLAFLVGAIFVGHYGWVSAGNVTMPAWGWLMMGLGIFFTLLVGGGLMAFGVLQ